MNPRPFHRWKSFWIGIFVIAFLGWAWVYSIGRLSYVLIPHGSKMEHFAMAQFDARISVGGCQVPQGMVAETKPPNDLDWSENEWFPPALDSAYPFDAGEGYSIAHWFLILLFLIPWTLWLVWRTRKFKRLAAEFELGSAGSKFAP